jgi:selenide,water dikinase
VQDIFQASDHPDLLVGLSDADDAAVWRLDESRALVISTDFFTPIVDDPRAYGAIAAANSLSDIYAMGGQPFLALNIAAFPENLPSSIVQEILKGGAEKAREAGVVIAGGHTIKDREPKYGLVAIGFVDPRKMLTKASLRIGDALVITKPLGFGLTSTALKRDAAQAADVEEAVNWMSQLNRTASQLALEFGLTAGTDVTGFGLLGHALEMTRASRVGLEIDFGALPFLKGAREYAAKAMFSDGLLANRSYFAPAIEFAPAIDEASQMILFDPQTSGGLLLGIPHDQFEPFSKRARELHQEIWTIGRTRAGQAIRVE